MKKDTISEKRCGKLQNCKMLQYQKFAKIKKLTKRKIKLYILKLSPALKDYIWGGTRLKTEFKIETPMQTVAEAWVLSAHKDGPSVIENGELKGKTLLQGIESFGRECLGTNCAGISDFPILIKLIDADKNLSVQVHPSDDYARAHEGEQGKTEMWYIVDCSDDAFIYYGFKSEISREAFIKKAKDGTIADCLNRVSVKKGDAYFIPAGTVHAIGKGCLIAEIQQNSNTTYRVFDYNRLGKDNKPRELHIDKAADVVNLSAAKEYSAKGNILAECKYFKVIKHKVEGSSFVEVGTDSFSCILCVDGSAFIDSVEIKKGECVFIPAGSGRIKIAGSGLLIESRV